MVTLKDVAERCGLSIATVSKALSGKEDINPKTIAFVQAVAKEMGYVPNASARMLKTNHSYSIGVLFLDNTKSGLQHEYFSVILAAVKDECEKNGYDITFLSNHIGNEAHTYYEHTRFRNCDGVVIANADYRDPEIYKLVNSEIPVVTIDYDFENRSSVNSDNVQGIYDIVEYVYGMGHRKIAFIHGELTSVTQKRINGFYRACMNFGIEVPDNFLKQGRYHIPKVSGAATRELLELEERPTCIIYPDDYSLLGGITEIERQGYKIPEDISVVGYDGIALSRLMRPEFTTYVQNAVEIGRLSAQKLIEKINNPKAAPERLLVKGYLQKGMTVKKIN